MDLRLILSVLLTLAPITELRIGMPLAILYSMDNNIPIIFTFLLIVIVNIVLVFLVFFFLDKIHHLFLGIGFYKRTFNRYLKSIQGKVDKFEKRHNQIGFYALMLFVAVPLPGTGAWSGCVIAWILGLDRKKSIMAITAGIMISAILILLGTLGFFLIL